MNIITLFYISGLNLKLLLTLKSHSIIYNNNKILHLTSNYFNKI